MKHSKIHPESVFPDFIGDAFTSGGGISLRDWFAGMAMQGIASNEIMARTIEKQPGSPHDVVASMAYVFADAMLAEREKTT